MFPSSEEAMRKAGTAHTKSSNDMENHVYIKAKTRVSNSINDVCGANIRSFLSLLFWYSFTGGVSISGGKADHTLQRHS